jgi:hypothetical protein
MADSVFESDRVHLAMITLRLFRVKPVPGPDTSRILLPPAARAPDDGHFGRRRRDHPPDRPRTLVDGHELIGALRSGHDAACVVRERDHRDYACPVRFSAPRLSRDPVLVRRDDEAVEASEHLGGATRRRKAHQAAVGAVDVFLNDETVPNPEVGSAGSATGANPFVSARTDAGHSHGATRAPVIHDDCPLAVRRVTSAVP